MRQRHLPKLIIIAVCLLILLSPLFSLATGIGQEAAQLSNQPIRLADGSLQSSPKAVALHQLGLPIRIGRLLSYPLLLFLIQYSGLAVTLRVWIHNWCVAPYSDKHLFQRIDKYLQQWTRTRLSLSDLIEIVVYITLLFMVVSLIFLPLSFYRGFILRHQFGLSTQTALGWWRDYGLTQGIGILTTRVVYGGFYILLKIMPRQWPIWGGAGFTVLFIGFFLLQPIVVTPLFYQISPITDTDLQYRIDAMAKRAGMVIDDVSIIDASNKTIIAQRLTGRIGFFCIRPNQVTELVFAIRRGIVNAFCQKFGGACR